MTRSALTIGFDADDTMRVFTVGCHDKIAGHA